MPLTASQRTELAHLRASYTALAASVPRGSSFDLARVFPDTDDLVTLLAQLDDLKLCLDSFRPFNAAQARNLREVWDTEFTYASNRIEGNTLTLRETSMVVHDGMTIGGKRLAEHLEAINHYEAIGFVRDLAGTPAPLTEADIKAIHALILHGIDREQAGVYRHVLVGIRGTRIVFPHPILVPRLMTDYIGFHEAEKDRTHPVALAALMHQKLIDIHPFVDGNGRTSRLVMNLLLLRAGYPITIIDAEESSRQAYFDALNLSRDTGVTTAFEVFIANNVKRWCMEYLKMLAPSIDASDQDKGHAFFKRIEPFLPVGGSPPPTPPPPK